MLLTPSQKLFNFKKMVLCSKLLWCKWPDLQNLYQANTEGSYEMTCRGLQDNQQPHPIPSPIHPHPATKHHRGFFAASSGHVYLHVLAARKVAKQIINSNRGCLKHLDQQILSKSRQNVRQITKNHHNASRCCMWTPFTPKYGCTMVCLPSSFWF